MVAHARAWASTADGNVYSRAHPEQWVDSPDLDGQVVGLPISSKFWDSLFDSAKAWGCLQSVYKTDPIQLDNGTPSVGIFLNSLGSPPHVPRAHVGVHRTCGAQNTKRNRIGRRSWVPLVIIRLATLQDTSRTGCTRKRGWRPSVPTPR